MAVLFVVWRVIGMALAVIGLAAEVWPLVAIGAACVLASFVGLFASER